MQGALKPPGMPLEGERGRDELRLTTIKKNKNKKALLNENWFYRILCQLIGYLCNVTGDQGCPIFLLHSLWKRSVDTLQCSPPHVNAESSILPWKNMKFKSVLLSGASLCEHSVKCHSKRHCCFHFCYLLSVGECMSVHIQWEVYHLS